eukprot:TRINITY_DN13571_c0_g1_i1.p1 TRINITY_DN13571_c0_g1~~TRINITY_DN13571_c0_g1_i1.p1  ORF type:complete len:318 (-),score=49.03 TRINITY_DN13571_c0_g1_i1:236-1189(-)
MDLSDDDSSGQSVSDSTEEEKTMSVVTHPSWLDNLHSKLPQLTPVQTTILQLIFSVAVFAGIMVGLSLFIKSPHFEQFMSWAQEIGPWGTLLTGGLLALAGLPFMVGYFIFCVACGLLHGWWALLVVPIADLIGYTMCYFLTRFFLRSWVLQKVENSKILQAVLFALDRNPIKFTILLRLTPITLGMQNSLLSVSSIEFWKYLLFSEIGHFPLVLLYVCIGNFTVRNITDVIHGASWDTTSIVAFVIQIVGTIVFLVVIGYFGRKTLKEMEELQGGGVQVVDINDVYFSNSSDSGSELEEADKIEVDECDDSTSSRV